MKNIKLPAPQLSYLKEVDIDLDMTGRHYMKLATSEGQVPEDVALDILTDLVKQDATELTLPELRYLFMLVKINALDNKYYVGISCTAPKPDGTICGHKQSIEIKLSDADLHRTPKKYTPPKVQFMLDKDTGPETFDVMVPRAKDEIELIRYFITDKGKTEEELVTDKATSIQYTFLRAGLHLQKNGEQILKTPNEYEGFLSLFDINSYKNITKLYDAMNEVDSFGVQNKTYETKCEECGGNLVFRTPLLHGLSD